jgi:c-di-GMP-binding flagellar brake protein YcgR
MLISDGEKITDPVRVASLLDRLAKKHSLLTVVVPGHSERYTTSIVGINGLFVLLDELLPSSGHHLFVEVGTLEVSGKVDGIDFRFFAMLEDVDAQDGMITYRVHLPARLEYRQRRMDYRAHIPIAQTLRVIIDKADESVIEGELYDLSQGGIGMILPGETPALQPRRWYECAFEMPDQSWLYCSVELCHARTIPSHDRHLVGARFSGLSVVQSQLVGRYIGMLERELLRKRTVE